MNPENPSKCAFLAKYLSLRPHVRGKADYAEVSCLLNDIVDKLLVYERKESDDYDDATRYERLLILLSKINPTHFRSSRGVTKLAGIKPNPMDLLIAAIYTGRHCAMNQLLATGQANFQSDISVLFAVDFAATVEAPLLAAVESRDPTIVRALLAHKAPFQAPSVRPRRPYRPSPLLLAVELNDLPIVTLLLNPPSTLDKSDLTYQHVLIKSISNPASQPITDLFLSHLSIPLTSCPYLLSEGLRAACRAGNTELITLLITNGANINTVMNYRQTHAMAAPIAQAAWKGQIPALNLLLSQGATLAPSPEGSVGIRVQHPGADALRAATWGNHWAAARVLLDAGVAEYLTQSDWCSVFKIAALTQCVDVAASLLDEGVVRLDGLTEDEVSSEDAVAELVAIVCLLGNVEFMRALVRHGVPVRQHGMYERGEYEIPIVQALAWKKGELVKLLEEVMGQEVDEEMRKLAEMYREKEAPRTWSRVGPQGCGMPRYTVLR